MLAKSPTDIFVRSLLESEWEYGEFSGSGEPCVIPERMVALDHPKGTEIIPPNSDQIIIASKRESILNG